MMTKKTRAMVAAGAGATVLLASGATFALWSDSDTIGGSDIQTGTLSIEAEDLTWVDNSADGFNQVGDEINPATFRLVPGDLIEGSAPLFTTDFQGDNMAVALDVTIGGVTETFYASPDHAFQLQAAADTVFGDLGIGDFDNWGLAINPALNPVTHELSLELDWRSAPANLGTAGTDSHVFQVGDIDLTLRQIRPNHPSAPWNN